ncbi:hypothetical protein ACHAW6_002742 [Cyclotella cf. meneghiniana]
MTKVPWGQSQCNVFKATYPGQCTSVDQFQSSQAGFVAQLKGKLTTRRYYYGTIFVDHFSRLRYVHFMTTQTSAETLQAKQAYKRFASERGIRIRHYHCNNGRFADNAFKQHAEQQQQTLTFCCDDDFFEMIELNKPDTMMSSNWQILAGLERPDQLPSVKQLLQVCNRALVPQDNSTMM